MVKQTNSENEMVPEESRPVRRRKLVVGIVLALAVVVFVVLGYLAFLWWGNEGSGLKVTSNNGGTARMDALKEQNKTKLQAKKTFTKGETATFDRYTVKVDAVNLEYAPEDTSLMPGEGKRFISVTLTVTNNSDRAVSINPYLFDVKDGDVIRKPYHIQPATTLESGALDRSNSVTGEVVYEVAADTQEYVLVYTTNAYQDGAYTELTYTLDF